MLVRSVAFVVSAARPLSCGLGLRFLMTFVERVLLAFWPVEYFCGNVCQVCYVLLLKLGDTMISEFSAYGFFVCPGLRAQTAVSVLGSGCVSLS